MTISSYETLKARLLYFDRWCRLATAGATHIAVSPTSLVFTLVVPRHEQPDNYVGFPDFERFVERTMNTHMAYCLIAQYRAELVQQCHDAYQSAKAEATAILADIPPT